MSLSPIFYCLTIASAAPSCDDHSRRYKAQTYVSSRCNACFSYHYITCGVLDDDILTIGAGRIGGTAIDEELELIDGSGSTTGAGGKDLRLERGVVG